MKKINPEDLVVGQKYYVGELRLEEKENKFYPFRILSDVHGNKCTIHESQPIYTHEESTDIELEMLVNVASRMYVSFSEICEQTNKDMLSMDNIAREALKLITACKTAIKEGER